MAKFQSSPPNEYIFRVDGTERAFLLIQNVEKQQEGNLKDNNVENESMFTFLLRNTWEVLVSPKGKHLHVCIKEDWLKLNITFVTYLRKKKKCLK